MRGRKVGRNDPCPCGSGKKYKKCCYGENIFNNHSNSKVPHSTLPPHDMIDYGVPSINESFFQKHTVHEISSPRFLYSNLLMPELAIEVSKVTNQLINRGRDEAVLIEKTDDINELINILNKGPDQLNRVRLKTKLIERRQDAMPLIMKGLQKQQCSAFAEIAIEIIHATGEDYSNEIIEIIEHYQRNAYIVSLLCMILGFYENDRSKKLLWDYYQYFKEHFPNETHSDGPLLAFEEMRARKKDKSRAACSNKDMTVH
jgi:hypothetical protein